MSSRAIVAPWKEWRTETRTNQIAYLEVLKVACGELDLIIGHVDQKVAIAQTDAAVAAYNFCAFVTERRCSHIVCEGAAVTGCLVCLFRYLSFGHGGVDICELQQPNGIEFVDFRRCEALNWIWHKLLPSLGSYTLACIRM